MKVSTGVALVIGCLIGLIGNAIAGGAVTFGGGASGQAVTSPLNVSIINTDFIDAGSGLIGGASFSGSGNAALNAVTIGSLTSGNGGSITTGSNGHVVMGADAIMRVNGKTLYMAGTGDVTRASGFGNTATLVSSSTASFNIVVGASPDAGGVVTLQSNTNGYSCHCEDVSDVSIVTRTIGMSATSCSFKSVDWAGATKTWTAGDTLTCTAFGN